MLLDQGDSTRCPSRKQTSVFEGRKLTGVRTGASGSHSLSDQLAYASTPQTRIAGALFYAELRYAAQLLSRVACPSPRSMALIICGRSRSFAKDLPD
jgi:hypothetical protein